MDLIKLLLSTPTDIVLTSHYLRTLGISKQQITSCVKRGLLTAFARGVYKKLDNKISEENALAAIHQDGIKVHVGGYKALASYHGVVQYLRVNTEYTLFSQEKINLPRWFTSYFKNFLYCPDHFLKTNAGIYEKEIKDEYKILISSKERAFLELLYSVPYRSVQECYELFEFLYGLRAEVVQELLENCTSIKVKRLFAYFCSIQEHPWNNQIDWLRIDLGSKNTCIIEKNGTLIKQFNIMIKDIKDDSKGI